MGLQLTKELRAHVWRTPCFPGGLIASGSASGARTIPAALSSIVPDNCLKYTKPLLNNCLTNAS